MEKTQTKARALLSAGDFLSSLVRTALSVPFADCRCLACGEASYGEVLCRRCREAFVSFVPRGEERCPYCGRLLVSEIGLCMECREKRVISSADSVLALHQYRLWHKNLLFAWKVQGRRSLSVLFADAVYRALEGSGCRTVVPVPPRPGKIRRRGWDQIDDVCAVLARRYGVRVLHLLTRLSCEQQKKKDREGRLSRKGAYALARGAGAVCGDLSEAVLLDDVITTGATVEECAGILKTAGIGKVHVLSLFIVD